MNEPHSLPRSSAENRLPRDPSVAASAPKSQPLSADEIERLLRLSQTRLLSDTAHPSQEDLGPGDVQHLRGESGGPLNAGNFSSLVHLDSSDSPSPEMLLERTQQQLAEAIFSAVDEPVHGTALPIPLQTNALRDNVQSAGGLTLEDLGDIELDISIELGRADLLIDDVLKLRAGSVVSLDKLAGDPVDIMANGRLVARGELLVVDGKFGVRLSEVL